jgi:hypothetical protein
MTSDMSLGELSRQVAQALLRIEGVAQRLESGQFVRTDVYDLQTKATEAKLKQVDEGKVSTEAHSELKSRVTKLEEANTWLIRVVIGFVVTAVLAFIFVQTGGAK